MCRRGKKARAPTCRRHPEPEQSQGLAHRRKMKHAPAEGTAAQGRRVKVEQRRHGAARAVVVMLLLLMTRLSTTAAAALLEPIFALESAFAAAFALETLLFGRAPAVADGVEVVVRRRCVLLQDIQAQALPVLAAHVHKERVVGDAEDAAGLRGRHALVPDVLERLGKVVVGPGARGAATRCAVLTL